VSDNTSRGKSWSNCIVPTSQLRDEILRHVSQLATSSKSTPWLANSPYPDEGWKDYLSHRTAAILNVRYEAVIRRLYGIMRGETVATKADIADALMLACGLHLDYDTSIQTFPGNIKDAREYVAIRAEARGIELSRARLEQRAIALIRYRDSRLWPNGYTGPSAISLRNNERSRRRKTALQLATSRAA